MKKTVIVMMFLAALTTFNGCGKMERAIAGFTGEAQETCKDGVLYLQFTSGASVKYTPDGRIATCPR